MAELLFLSKDDIYTHPDPETDRRAVYKKGDCVDVFEDGGAVGNEIVPEKFVVMEVQGASKDDIRFYRESWDSQTTFTEISVNPVTDSARVGASFDLPGTQNLYPATRENTEPGFNWWGATFANAQVNDIRYDVAVVSAYLSDGFWEWGAPGEDDGPLPIQITETDYDQPTRTHTATIDRTGSIWDWNYIQSIVERRGGTVTNINGDTGTMTITGQPVVDAMKESLYGIFLETNVRRRYQMTVAQVNLIKTLPNGRISMSPEEAAQNIVDKANV